MENQAHNFGRSIKRVAGVVLYVAIAAIIGYLLLVLAYYIPVSWMQENLTESVTIIANESRADDHMYNTADNLNDLLTDSFMFLAAVHEDTENPWQAAADVMLDNYQDQRAEEVLIAEYQDGKEPTSVFSYGRYWHGYLILLKPLLCLFDYGQIRYLMTIGQLALLLLVMSVAYKRLGVRYTLALFAAYLWLNPLTTMTCMQYNTIAVLTLAFLAVLLMRAEYWMMHGYHTVLLFCTYGLLTSYFDLLTYPLVTLGLPLLTLIVLQLHASNRGQLRSVILNTVSWGFGYFGMWVLKWVYGSVILGREMFSEALYNAEKRSFVGINGSNEGITYINTLKVNVAEASEIAYVACLIILLIIVFRGKGWRRILEWKKGWCLLVVAIYPLLWYAAFQNHSYIHSWFTFRELAIGVYGGLLFAAFIKEHN